jgi:hypothetical protein
MQLTRLIAVPFSIPEVIAETLKEHWDDITPAQKIVWGPVLVACEVVTIPALFVIRALWKFEARKKS